MKDPMKFVDTIIIVAALVTVFLVCKWSSEESYAIQNTVKSK